ncbi:MAG: A/G-specific adenine glycosylase [Chitinophagales bacterium]|nr:A/G-specific adenine glycosylase [Chitinophagales bacterium]
MITFFQKALLDWYKTQNRRLPWKDTKNPYYIWLSEIILQQTRVEQGMPYYLRFVEKYPTVQDLANASIDEVLKLWEGLGYYSRARNLHETAKIITEKYSGVFPFDYEEILALKGVGEYTAAAISSFAYNYPKAVVDGNVYRVLSRFFLVETPIDTLLGKKHFRELAETCFDRKHPAIYNQAIMDFGATVCKPQLPLCAGCPLQINCQALYNKAVSKLPIKEKSLQKKTRYFRFLVVKDDNKVLLQKRTQEDIWKGLYQLPKMEIMDKQSFETFAASTSSVVYQQLLTHRRICAIFQEIEKEDPLLQTLEDLFWIDAEIIHTFAFPKIIREFLKDKII